MAAMHGRYLHLKTPPPLPKAAETTQEEDKQLPNEEVALKIVKAMSIWDFKLVRFQDLPDYLREPYVLNGYRPELRSTWLCIQSIFRLHNQSGEIFTHLIPLVIYFGLGCWTVATLPISTPIIDYLLFINYFVGVCICLGASSLYHILICHSEAVHNLMYSVDRLGIVAPFVASMLFLTYFGFACQPQWRMIHMLASIITGGLVIRLIFAGKDTAHPASAGFRIFVSVAMFSVGLGSMVHMAYEVPYASSLAMRFLGTYIAYAIGMAFYVTRIPERWFPGYFDYIGKSHQIWHVMVVVGALNFLPIILQTYQFYTLNSCTHHQ